MLNRKFKKLVKNPKLFFDDMFIKHKKKFKNNYGKKTEGHYQYTVVSAVYNVARYLDEFFASFINQKLEFRKHIQLVMVDDGSSDESARIIKKWQKKYPNNIHYIFKENGGQSSARNFGLQYCNNEWVTFIDPDDFIDRDYFYNIDKFLFAKKNENFLLLSSKIMFFYEKSKTSKDSHPLTYKFKNGNAIVPINDLGKNIQLSASASFFKLEHIKSYGVTFDTELKPNFEDGKFIADYLLYASQGYAAFISDSIYYYRKREDGSSTLDTAWQKTERFTVVPKKGYLETLKKYQEHSNFIPLHLQRTIIYEALWNIKWLVNNAEKASFLTDKQKQDYIEDLKAVFAYIDIDSILNFELAGCWFYYKVGMLSLFKSENPDNQITYIERFDAKKRMVQLRYFANHVTSEKITLDGYDINYYDAKTIRHDFLGNDFVLERRIWISIDNGKILKFSINDKESRLSLASKHYQHGVDVDKIIKHFQSITPNFKVNRKYAHAWLFMDRDTQADDNAEHLYRYVQQNHHANKIYFILRKDSHDWSRLENDGFNLIAFGSEEHEDALRSCDKVISSHADKYVTNYLGPKMLEGKHFVFLQHGVTKDDISGWLNRKENIDCFVTASVNEYDSICQDNTRYYYGKKEVVLTGFPRHDKLIHNKGKHENLIIIMPTWRLNIVGPVINGGNEREINEDFMSTSFAVNWSNFLHSEKLKDLATKFNYRVAFFPHANIQPYLSMFNVPEYINVVTHSEGSIQNLFNKASLMITDYSSVAFELAIQEKQTIYFQFDEDDCFSGSHIYSKGYFDYRRDGFGPVVNTLESLIYSLENALKREAIPEMKIIDRIRNTFPCRDGKCCERTYNAICELDKPLDNNFRNLHILKEKALSAVSDKKFNQAESLWTEYFSQSNVFNIKDQLNYILSLIMQGKLHEANAKLMVLPHLCEKNSLSEVNEMQALLAMSWRRWKESINLWQNNNPNLYNESYLFCLAYAKDKDKLANLISHDALIAKDNFLDLYLSFAEGNWEDFIELFENHFNYFQLFNETYPPYLLLLVAHAYSNLGDYARAHESLIKFEEKNSNDINCKYEIARLAFLRGNWSKVISQLHAAFKDINSLPAEFCYYYIQALKKLKKIDDLRKFQQGLSFTEFASYEDRFYYALILNSTEQWDEAINIWATLDMLDSTEVYGYADALYQLGNFKKAWDIIKTSHDKMNSEGWYLRTYLSQLNDDWNDAYYSWRQYILASVKKPSPDNLEKLQKYKMLSELTRVNLH
ncbi:CDP-glycerol glycerophosphotransferase family protein [Atlantibacter hermannii]|uniref:CDP-glycerol glycerophosphotransferase family protein n=1 Tax=Atlantibacter hermannii TaxID=565 RepID=UPI0022B7B50B|nr:CDP-glycerol glycerophosphotransferase family protein [Atlantibacter hermannii]MCZ7833612.1 CDP-glycerol:glycerophosphate glycerophosphotransferase [Atlantibacter hermannii]